MVNYSKINYINPQSLIPYERNTKKHPESQTKKLAKLIENYGFPESKAILVDEKLTIVTGHGRRLSAIAAGLKEVPYQIISDISDIDIQALRIADNAIAESDWDYELLKFEYEDLGKHNFDLDLLALDGNHLKQIESIISIDDEDKTIDFEEAFSKVQDGEKTPFSQMTFTVHDSQKEIIEDALKEAKTDPSFDKSDNANGNGSALYLLTHFYLNHVS